MHVSRQSRRYTCTTTSNISRNDEDDPQFKKLSWLRSQIIGQNVDFISPFGKHILTYADHTASGRSLYYIEDYIINNVLPFYGNTHTSDSYVGYRTTKMVNKATNYIRKCLGGGEDDALLFCGSGTTSAIKKLQEMMGITVPSNMRKRVIKCLGNEERWIVFVGPFEHHSNILSWRESLAEVVEIGLNEDGMLDMEALKKKLEFYRSRTKRPILGSFSACSNVTGICSDTRGIARLFHQFGGYACFDFAASGPYTKIDMRSGEIDGYDAIFISPHKFIGGPGSPGILLANKVLYRLRSSPPSTCGGGTVAYVNGFNAEDTLYVDNIEEREDAGTPAITQKIRAALAFWVKEYIGYKIIQNKEQSHIKQALESLLQNPNIKVLGNTTSKREAILSFLVYPSSPNLPMPPLANVIANMNTGDLKGKLEASTYTKRKPLHGPFVAKLLNDLFGIQARGGCACAGPYGHSLLNVDESQSLAIRSTIKKGHNGVKPGWTRISFPYYMSNEEFEFILEAVQFISIHGQRFLPLYHFNWYSGEWTFNKKMANENLLLTKRIIDNFLSYDSSSVSNNSSLKASRNETLRFEYTKYLETAKLLADCLPEFRPPRYIPKEIDPALVYFRV